MSVLPLAQSAGPWATALQKLRGLAAQVVSSLPNLFTQSVTVNTAFPTRRIEYDVGIGYGDDIERAKALILEVLGQLPEALDDPAPDVLTHELASSSVVLRVRWWIQPPARQDALDARDHVMASIKQKLLANGIDLPFPTQHVLFHDQTEGTDGDRRRQREGWPAGKGDVPPARPVGSALATVERERTGPRARGDD